MQQEKNGYHDPHKSLEKRPGITSIESPNVGKHTLLSRSKVDLVPGHPVHSEYRKLLLKAEDSFAKSHLEFVDYGNFETKGSSLLRGDEPSLEIRNSCLEWCTEQNIEFIISCACNPDFDKCLSADGDSQGVERLLGVLSAHIWRGMILKSRVKITEPPLPEREGILTIYL